MATDVDRLGGCMYVCGDDVVAWSKRIKILVEVDIERSKDKAIAEELPSL
jgi:hypothetical protein